jgi:hypothetical protein
MYSLYSKINYSVCLDLDVSKHILICRYICIYKMLSHLIWDGEVSY